VCAASTQQSLAPPGAAARGGPRARQQVTEREVSKSDDVIPVCSNNQAAARGAQATVHLSTLARPTRPCAAHLDGKAQGHAQAASTHHHRCCHTHSGATGIVPSALSSVLAICQVLCPGLHRVDGRVGHGGEGSGHAGGVGGVLWTSGGHCLGLACPIHPVKSVSAASQSRSRVARTVWRVC
jgi:hypothetical protein